MSSLQILAVAYGSDPERRDDRSQVVAFVSLARRTPNDATSTVLGRIDRRRAHVLVRRSDGDPNDALRVGVQPEQVHVNACGARCFLDEQLSVDELAGLFQEEEDLIEELGDGSVR